MSALAVVAGLTAVTCASTWSRTDGAGHAVSARRQIPSVALDALPSEARATHRTILVGGPFPYSKDGIVFGNRERQLPAQPRGVYREYTVPTPGASDRGARRIVCAARPPSPPSACYYTADHYASFRYITP